MAKWKTKRIKFREVPLINVPPGRIALMLNAREGVEIRLGETTSVIMRKDWETPMKRLMLMLRVVAERFGEVESRMLFKVNHRQDRYVGPVVIVRV